jgi:hypothetical protein
MTTAPRTEPRDRGSASTEEAVNYVPPPRRSWAWLGIAGWVAAAAMGVAVGTFWETIIRLRYELRIRDERVTELTHRLAHDQRWTTVLSAPGLRVAELALTSAPSERSTPLRGSAMYDPGTQRAIVVFQEAFPPQGRDYQLWALRGGVPMDLGVLRPDTTGIAIYRLENMGAPGVTAGFRVSLEPKGGTPTHTAPSGPTILEGSIPH